MFRSTIREREFISYGMRDLTLSMLLGAAVLVMAAALSHQWTCSSASQQVPTRSIGWVAPVTTDPWVGYF